MPFARTSPGFDLLSNKLKVIATLTFPNFLLVSDLGIQIASVRIVHDNAQTPLVHERLFVRDDVRMSHSFKHMHFIDRVFTLFTVHFAHVDNFHDILQTICDRLHKHSIPK